jgi:hypothetical protein
MCALMNHPEIAQVCLDIEIQPPDLDSLSACLVGILVADLNYMVMKCDLADDAMKHLLALLEKEVASFSVKSFDFCECLVVHNSEYIGVGLKSTTIFTSYTYVELS